MRNSLPKLRPSLKKLGNALLQVLMTFVICIIIRVVFFEIYYVPSGSMENTIYPGEFVFVNKLPYGARLPGSISETPWVNILSYLFTNHNDLSDYSRNARLKAFDSVSRNDIVVFNQPLNTNDFFIKRCVGLPGDTLTFRDTSISLNHKILVDNLSIKYYYKVCFKKGADYGSLLNNLGIGFTEEWSERMDTFKKVNLSLQQLKHLKRLPAVIKICRYSNEEENTAGISPKSQVSREFKLPFRGLTIPINETNIKNYSSIILAYENSSCKIRNEKLYNKEGTQLNSYTFHYNYFFMMGDNRNESSDSRQWGYVPEYFIVGKASFIILPKHKLNLRRYFTILR